MEGGKMHVPVNSVGAGRSGDETGLALGGVGSESNSESSVSFGQR